MSFSTYCITASTWSFVSVGNNAANDLRRSAKYVPVASSTSADVYPRVIPSFNASWRSNLERESWILTDSADIYIGAICEE